jgi:hypothetical protein
MKPAMTARRLCFGLAATTLLALPSTAVAAKKVDKKAPVVTKVTPKRAKVGDVLVVTGRNFVRGRGKNQVFFLTKGGGTWTKAADASTKRLKVKIPSKLANLLPANGDQARIQLRIKAKRLGKNSAARISPLISINPNDVGGDPNGSNPGVIACTPNPSNPASDVDQDLLSDARERELLLDACNRDTDADGTSDGYEYYSAIDLNSSNALPEPYPYPGKRPYPNPLFKDAEVDYDGDGLNLWDEYSLWTKFGGGGVDPLYYSDGLQHSVEGAARDDERDEDGDGLGNWDESHGPMQPDWWISEYERDPWNETPYTVKFAGTDMLDRDSDGDGLRDGDDDQDFDGLPNTFEVRRPDDWPITYVSTGPGALGQNWNGTAVVDDVPADGIAPNIYSRVQPFNPCKPVWSSRCHVHWPFDYYGDDEDWQGVTSP